MGKVLGAFVLGILFGFLGALFNFFGETMIQGWLATQQGIWVQPLSSFLSVIYGLGLVSFFIFLLIDIVLWFIVFLVFAGILVALGL